MLTVKELIDELEKVDNKEMEIAVRIDTHITSIIDTFEAEADGVPFICIDCEK